MKQGKMMTFKMHETTNQTRHMKVSMSVGAQNLGEILDEFRNFLRACGFAIEGDLVVQDNEPADEPGGTGDGAGDGTGEA